VRIHLKILLPKFDILVALNSTQARSIGFCVIWVCISSSSSVAVAVILVCFFFVGWGVAGGCGRGTILGVLLLLLHPHLAQVFYRPTVLEFWCPESPASRARGVRIRVVARYWYSLFAIHRVEVFVGDAVVNAVVVQAHAAADESSALVEAHFQRAPENSPATN